MNNTIRTTLMLAALSLPMSAMATNGYLLHGYGKNKGLGGAGSANPQDALAGATNPAGSAWVGDRFDFTGELFSPKRGYEISNKNPDVTNAGSAWAAMGIEDENVRSEKEIFIIPAMGIVKEITDDFSFGFAFYGAGLGTEYNRNDTTELLPNNEQNLELNGTFFDGSTGVDLLLLITNWHGAYKITDKISVGVGVNIAGQSFKAKGLRLFRVLSQGEIAEKGRDWAFGYGGNIGIQAEVFDGFTVAAAYFSEIGLKHKKYDGLFANKGDFSLPQQWTIGFTWKPIQNHAFSFDLQKIYWSDIAATGNQFTNFLNMNFDPEQDVSQSNLPITLLGDEDGAGFGFADSEVYKFGYQFKLDALPSWTWRVGYAYQDQIIPSTGTLFPIVAPATIQHHYTFGFSKQLTKMYEVNMNALYTGKEYVRGTRESEGVDIYLEEYGLEFGIGVNF